VCYLDLHCLSQQDGGIGIPLRFDFPLHLTSGDVLQCIIYHTFS